MVMLGAMGLVMTRAMRPSSHLNQSSRGRSVDRRRTGQRYTGQENDRQEKSHPAKQLHANSSNIGKRYWTKIYQKPPIEILHLPGSLETDEVQLQTERSTLVTHKDDQDRFKGAVEEGEMQNTSMQGQLGHRDQDPMLKSADTDFPEPGENPEHSGEPTTDDHRKPKPAA